MLTMIPHEVNGEVWVIAGLPLEKPDPLSRVTDWVEVGNAHLCILQGWQGLLFAVVVHEGEKPYARVLGIFPSLESAEAFLEQVGS